ncbi:MAG: hypothetical protein JW384_02799 [Nitrosomonadaceae bacterium]|nr:hypothetical protein [Nitrosomonadaceae bacterium]
MDPTIVIDGIPQWASWFLIAIIVPSGAWLATQFVEFMKLKEELATAAQVDFRNFLADLHRKTESDRKEERQAWQRVIESNTKNIETLTASVRELYISCKRNQ